MRGEGRKKDWEEGIRQVSQGLHTHLKDLELILQALGKPVEILKKLSDADRDLKTAGWATDWMG